MGGTAFKPLGRGKLGGRVIGSGEQRGYDRNGLLGEYLPWFCW